MGGPFPDFADCLISPYTVEFLNGDPEVERGVGEVCPKRSFLEIRFITKIFRGNLSRCMRLKRDS